MNKALLTQAFERMGIRRVTRGLPAKHHDWGRCFLALAYKEHDLNRAPCCPECFLASKTRLTRLLINAVVGAYDSRPVAFRELAAEWLELNRKESAPSVPKIPSRAVGVRTNQRKGIKVSVI